MKSGGLMVGKTLGAVAITAMVMLGVTVVAGGHSAKATVAGNHNHPAHKHGSGHGHGHEHQNEHYRPHAVDASCVVALAPEVPLDSQSRRLNALKKAAGHGEAISSALLTQLGGRYLEAAQQEPSPQNLSLLLNAAECLSGRDAESAAADYFMAFVLYSEHQFPQAAALLEAVVAKRGLAADWALLGDAYLEQGDTEAASQAYQKMLNLKPGPDGYARVALVREQRGDLAGALLALEKADKSLVVDSKGAAWIRAQRARLQLVLGEFAQARALVQSVQESQPGYAPGWYVGGMVALAEELNDAALAQFREAVLLAPTPQNLWALMEAQKNVGDNASADASMQQLLRSGAMYDPLTAALFMAVHGIELGAAEELLAHELGDRSNSVTLDGMAWTQFQRGDVDAAWAIVRRALAGGSQDARLHLHAAVIARAVGEELVAGSHLKVAEKYRHTLLRVERERLVALLAG